MPKHSAKHALAAAALAVTGASAQEAGPEAATLPESEACDVRVNLKVENVILDSNPACPIKGSASNQLLPGTVYLGVAAPSQAPTACFNMFRPNTGTITAFDGRKTTFKVTGISGVLAGPFPPGKPYNLSADNQYANGSATARSDLVFRFKNGARGTVSTLDRISGEFPYPGVMPSRPSLNSELLTAFTGSTVTKSGERSALFKSMAMSYDQESVINPGPADQPPSIKGATVTGSGCLYKSAARLVFGN